MDLKYLDRLAFVQENAINETDSQIKQLEKHVTDYKSLRERLLTLADRVTYDVMVPFGSVAFMPGKLVHTNEIRVFLGDTWFVDRSAKQAIEIIDRRIQSIDEDLKGFQKQKEYIKPHLDFATMFREESKDHLEIMEECNEEELKAWRVQHRLNVKKDREEQMEASKAGNPKEEEELYWKMMEEAEGEELSNLSSEHKVPDPSAKDATKNVKTEVDLVSCQNLRTNESSDIHEMKKAAKTVRWQDIVQKDKKKMEASSSDDSEEYVELCRPSVIHFVHSSAANVVQPIRKSNPTESGVQQIVSPADIGASPATPKSILKKRPSTEEENVRQASEGLRFHSGDVATSNSQTFLPVQLQGSKDHLQKLTSTAQPLQASSAGSFEIKIVEKNVNSTLPEATSQVTHSSSDAVLNNEPTKRVSAFKAARMQKTSTAK